MTPYIPVSLRQQVRREAAGRCAYCRSFEDLMGISFEIDHIVPRSESGATTLANLCLSCPTCNRHKANKQIGVDPSTGDSVPLFHPRKQAWDDHFSWSNDGLRLLGTTPSGRATVHALSINRAVLVQLRSYWKALGLHPPE